MAFIAFTDLDSTNSCCLINKHLESHFFFKHRQGLRTRTHSKYRQGSTFYLAITIFSSFTNVSSNKNILLSSTEFSSTSYLLWCEYHCCAGIKDSTLIACSSCKHTCRFLFIWFWLEKGVQDWIYCQKLPSNSGIPKIW